MIGILYNIRSVHNVASIFRTADGVGVEKLYICGITPEPVDRIGRVRKEFRKVALGAGESVVWEKVGTTLRPQATLALCDRLRADGYTIVALEQEKHALSYNSVEVKETKDRKIALIVGNEVDGLPESIISCADTCIEIPMRGSKESLNVSVAFGIAAYALSSRYPQALR